MNTAPTGPTAPPATAAPRTGRPEHPGAARHFQNGAHHPDRRGGQHESAHGGPHDGRNDDAGTGRTASGSRDTGRTDHAERTDDAGRAHRADGTPAPLHRRDGILPAIAAALSVRGETLTCTGSKGDRPPAPHPLIQDFLDALPAEDRARHTGRCAETVLLSRFLTATEAARAGKRTARNPTAKPRTLSYGEAKRALKHGKLTARHIREDGDPLHGGYAPPCRSCAALLDHLGVRAVDPGPLAGPTGPPTSPDSQNTPAADTSAPNTRGSTPETPR